jgi:hypothetical protein
MIDQHPIHIRPQQIAQHAQMQRQVGVHQIARLRAQSLVPHELPQLAQVLHVGQQGFGTRVLGGGAHDVARILVGLDAGQHRAAQSVALGLILDAGGHAHALALRHVHEIARRQRDVGGEPSTLGPQRILDHLHQNLVALRHQRANVVGARRFDAGVRMARIENIRRMQKRRALHADFDESRLHARQHPRHSSLVDIADEAAAAGALEKSSCSTPFSTTAARAS